MSIKELYQAMAQSVIEGEPEEAARLAQQGLAAGLEPLAIIEQGFAAGIKVVGELFAKGEYFLPDLVIGAKAMEEAMAVLESELHRRQETRRAYGKVVIGTVQGDIHEIGKNLVATLLSVNGFEVLNLGVDVPDETFIAKVKETRANVLGMSALLTTTMPAQGRVIQALEEAGIRDKVKVIIGGAPVTQSWADEIGADGYSEDAVGAVALAKRLLGI
jgi:corrinoid protein of di/trimethylamine methyltransferase